MQPNLFRWFIQSLGFPILLLSLLCSQSQMKNVGTEKSVIKIDPDIIEDENKRLATEDVKIEVQEDDMWDDLAGGLENPRFIIKSTHLNESEKLPKKVLAVSSENELTKRPLEKYSNLSAGQLTSSGNNSIYKLSKDNKQISSSSSSSEEKSSYSNEAFSREMKRVSKLSRPSSSSSSEEKAAKKKVAPKNSRKMRR